MTNGITFRPKVQLTLNMSATGVELTEVVAPRQFEGYLEKISATMLKRTLGETFDRILLAIVKFFDNAPFSTRVKQEEIEEELGNVILQRLNSEPVIFPESEAVRIGD